VIDVGISKSYGDFEAVKDLRFSVKKGEILGLLGPNGAGKSTTLRSIVGLITPTEGDVKIDGISVRDGIDKLKPRIGFLPEETALYKSLTVLEYLELFCELYGCKRERMDKLMEDLEVEDFKKKRCGELSKGMKRRVAIARTLLHDPQILVLDEPTSGLDPVSNRKIRKLILKEHKKGKTIILSSHILSEIEKTAEKILILVGGKKVVEGPLSALKADYLTKKKEEFTLILPEKDESKAKKKFKKMKKEGGYLIIESKETLKKLLSKIKGLEVISIKRNEPDLEDIFFEGIKKG
jgi:ABC-2 type transport system ATP-binding protein